MNKLSTVDYEETQKFAALADDWWNESGAFITLHKLNSLRLSFISEGVELKGKSLLDVGCGGGILAESLSKSGAHVTGIDAELTAIEAAKKHAATQKLTLQYACMPIEECTGQYDVITCMELLEHVSHPECLIEKAASLLKPGGHFFLSTINRNLKAYLYAIVGAEYLLKLLPKQTHDYDKFLKPSEIAYFARKAGLKLIQLKGMAYNPLTHHASLVSDVSVNYLMHWTAN